ncbi:MAG TPA: extracellular solute-binding protein [Bacilli bacterium]
MKKNKFRSIGICFIVFMFMFVTACSNNPESTDPTKNETTAPDKKETPEPVAKADPFGKYDPPIEVTTVKQTTPADVYAPGDSLENNIYTRGQLDELGITVKYKWTADSSVYADKLSVMIASGDIPDFMQVSPVQYKQLYEAGLLLNLEDIYQEYAAPITRKLIEEDGGKLLDSARIDGKLYALPFNDDGMNQAPMLWVRKDWLTNLNLPEPKTMDDVINIARAFKTQDPDKNKINDTFGLGLNPTDYRGFVNGYHAYMGIWAKGPDGKLAPGYILPEMKTALMKLQELFKEGLIDKEFVAKGQGKVFDDVVAGKIGIYFQPFWAPFYPLVTSFQKDGAQWQSYPLVSADDQPVKSETFSGGLPIFNVVSKNAKNPEAVIKLLNFFASKTLAESTEFNNDYLYTAEGVQTYSGSNIYMWPMNKNLKTWRAMKEAFDSGDTSKLNPEDLSNYKKVKEYLDGNKDQYPLGAIFSPAGSYYTLHLMTDRDGFYFDEFYGVPTDTMSDKGTVLSDLRDQVFPKIIMGESSITEFDKFVEDWNKLGGSKMIEEVNAWYDAKQIKK